MIDLGKQKQKGKEEEKRKVILDDGRVLTHTRGEKRFCLGVEKQGSKT